MPRKQRLFVPGGFYHVYCRAHRGEMRFAQRVDSHSFVSAVSDIARTHRLSVLGFALMSNHYHLVVRTGDVQLWRSMAAIQARVTREHNRRQRVFGPGWQSRYRARLVLDDHDLRQLLAYVHLNPVVAGLVDDPADYELSGHRALIGMTAPIPVDADAALRCFGEETTTAARLAYLDCLCLVANVKWARGSLRQLPWWRPVRDDHQTVETERAPLAARTFDDRHPAMPPPPEVDSGQLLVEVCSSLGVTPADLTGTSRRPSIHLARRRFVYIAVTHFGIRGKAVARSLAKSPSQVSRWLTDQMAACAGDPAEAELIDDVAAGLLRSRARGSARSANLAPQVVHPAPVRRGRRSHGNPAPVTSEECAGAHSAVRWRGTGDEDE